MLKTVGLAFPVGFQIRFEFLQANRPDNCPDR